MKKLMLIPILLTLMSCTSVKVESLSKDSSIKQVCIENNPKVKVSDFTDVVREGLSNKGIRSVTFSGKKPTNCDAILTYTALRSWDFKPYLSHAELRIWKDGLIIASAEYHLNGGGGLSFSKWGSTREKILPVMDELLKHY